MTSHQFRDEIHETAFHTSQTLIGLDAKALALVLPLYEQLYYYQMVAGGMEEERAAAVAERVMNLALDLLDELPPPDAMLH